MVSGYRCSVFGIAAVDATVRTNLVIATAPFTGAFGQQDFIGRNHTSPNISISMKNDNARGRWNQTAGETSAPQLPDALSDVTAGKPAAIWRRSRPPPAVKSVSRLTGINCGGRKSAYHGAYDDATSP
jgi:hypothetical protein